MAKWPVRSLSLIGRVGQSSLYKQLVFQWSSPSSHTPSKLLPLKGNVKFALGSDRHTANPTTITRRSGTKARPYKLRIAPKLRQADSSSKLKAVSRRYTQVTSWSLYEVICFTGHRYDIIRYKNKRRAWLRPHFPPRVVTETCSMSRAQTTSFDWKDFLPCSWSFFIDSSSSSWIRAEKKKTN